MLYLASGSAARKRLLEEAGIDFVVVAHCSKESVGDGLKIKARVSAIARDKMKCVDLSSLPTDRPAFVLTADTLVKLKKTDVIFGKPNDQLDARRMIAAMRKEEIVFMTGCCLEKRIWVSGNWKTEQKAEWVAGATCMYQIPDSMVDEYFRRVPNAVTVCGGCMVDGYGGQFLKKVSGSYSAILGLPMSELSEQLKKLQSNR